MADYADMFASIGAESRLQILRLLLGADPDGTVVGDILAFVRQNAPAGIALPCNAFISVVPN
jgi:hypothetical protein